MNNRKSNGNGKFFVLALLLLVIGVSIGYAALSKTLNINGTSNIANNAKWDIHLTNVQVTPGSANASKAAVIEGDTVSFSVDLNTPGDYYEFTVDVTNAGTIDAKLSSTPTLPTLTPDQQKYVTYTITYDEGGALTGNDPLNHGETKTVKVRLEFKKDITELPTDLGTLNLNFAMKYVQK